MPEKSSTLYPKHGSFWVRKAQRALLEQAITPNVENVTHWIETEKAKIKKKKRK